MELVYLGLTCLAVGAIPGVILAFMQDWRAIRYRDHQKGREVWFFDQGFTMGYDKGYYKREGEIASE